MDFSSLIGPAVVAAGVSGVISVISLVVSNRTARRLHTEKLGFDSQLAERKFQFPSKRPASCAAAVEGDSANADTTTSAFAHIRLLMRLNIVISVATP
jgi:hypothetical protein